VPVASNKKRARPDDNSADRRLATRGERDSVAARGDRDSSERNSARDSAAQSSRFWGTRPSEADDDAVPPHKDDRRWTWGDRRPMCHRRMS